MNGKATILVISLLVSIIKHLILDMKSIGYSAVDSRDMTASEIRKKHNVSRQTYSFLEVKIHVKTICTKVNNQINVIFRFRKMFLQM